MSNVTISAKEVAELRARTSAGIADCKNALVEAGGDMNRAVEILRTKGIAKAEKRVGRVASEGRIACLTSTDGQAGILLELNSETDFVSRGDGFGALTEALGAQLLADTTCDGIVLDAADGAGENRSAFEPALQIAAQLRRRLIATLGPLLQAF